MEDLGRLLTIALAIVTIATLAGGGLLVGTVTRLRNSLKDSDDELGRTKRRLDESVAEARVLRADLDALARVVTGEAHWVAIGEKMDEHHRGAEGHWIEEKVLLEEIRDRLPTIPPEKV